MISLKKLYFTIVVSALLIMIGCFCLVEISEEVAVAIQEMENSN